MKLVVNLLSEVEVSLPIYNGVLSPLGIDDRSKVCRFVRCDDSDTLVGDGVD